jgi:glycosyltransferase involved in cell wall biosynthesis
MTSDKGRGSLALTVVSPDYHEEEVILSFLERLEQALLPELRPWEVIVVDDG